MNSGWTGIYGTQRDDACRQCGQRHHQNSRQNRICQASDERDVWAASAGFIVQMAAQARSDAERHMARAARLSDPTSRLAQAAEAYALAYELEN